ncbi:MAG: hypothetical protein AAF495_25405 [Pseudomonadota bacterium]
MTKNKFRELAAERVLKLRPTWSLRKADHFVVVALKYAEIDFEKANRADVRAFAEKAVKDRGEVWIWN